MSFINQDLLEEEEPSTSKENSSVKANDKNEQEFSNLMKHAGQNYDSYWDKNNIFLRVFMILLGLFIIVGTIYFIVLWKSSK